MAPLGTAKRALLEENLKFWPSKGWPPASPDLAPLDHSIRAIIEVRACATPHKNVEELKASVDLERAATSLDFIRKTCQRFRPLRNEHSM